MQSQLSSKHIRHKSTLYLSVVTLKQSGDKLEQVGDTVVARLETLDER